MPPSEFNKVLELFFNEPTKHWHFSEIVNIEKISESSTNTWLKKLLKEKIINLLNPNGKMPYFQGNWEHPNYKAKKRIYALSKLAESGLLSKLMSLENAKTIVIFGSFSRSDWNTNSDIDVFIYGDPEDLKFGTIWENLGFHKKEREIQVHTFKSKKDINNIKSNLITNVIEGYFVKGSANDLLEATS